MKERDWIQQKINIEFNEFLKDIAKSRITKEGLEYEIFGEKVKKVNDSDKDMKSISNITKTILNFFRANSKFVMELVEAQDGKAK